MDYLFGLLVSLASPFLAFFRGKSRSHLSKSTSGKTNRRVSTERRVLWGAYSSKKTVSETSQWDGRSND